MSLFTEMQMTEKPPMTDAPPLRKFMFDRSFDGSMDAPAVRPRQPVTLKPEQVDALKQESYDSGFAAGRQVAADAGTAALTAAIAQLDAKIADLIDNIQAIQRDNDLHVRKAIAAIAAKIMPDFIARNGLQEIQALLTSAMTEMLHEPRLVVRIHESLFDAVNAKIHEITAQKAYAGKIVVLADAGVASGDCRIEWADGGIERNAAAQLNTIEKTLEPSGEALSPPPTDVQEMKHG